MQGDKGTETHYLGRKDATQGPSQGRKGRDLERGGSWWDSEAVRGDGKVGGRQGGRYRLGGKEGRTGTSVIGTERGRKEASQWREIDGWMEGGREGGREGRGEGEGTQRDGGKRNSEEGGTRREVGKERGRCIGLPGLG